MSTNKDMTFESAITRLEEIARLLESGEDENGVITLERSLELYEEGSRLAAFCSGTLKDAEQRITKLSINDTSAQ